MTIPTTPATNQFVIGPLVDRLRVARVDVSTIAPWIDAASAEPNRFLEAMIRLLGERRGVAMESSPGRFEGYQDLVVGQLARRRPIAFERTPSGEKSATVADLHARATRLAATWVDHGVEPGKSIAFVMPAGIESLAALLAALRVGATITWIPPTGRTFVLNRVEALAPDFLVASQGMRRHLERFDEQLLPTEPARGTKDGPSRGFSYVDDAPVFRLFSPHARESLALFDIAAKDVLASLLRCALFGIAGDANDVLVWPELDELAHEPLFTLAAMLGGVARVFCKTADVVAHPEWVSEARTTMIGVGPTLREEILREGPERWKSVRAWLREDSEPVDFDRMRAFEKRVEPGRWRRTDLFHVAAAGGLLTFGVEEGVAKQAMVLPAPGLAWALLDPVGTGKLASGTVGLFARMIGEEPDRAGSCFAVAKQGPGWVTVGSIVPGRYGRTFPSVEVCAAVRPLAFVEEVDVIVSKKGANDGLVTMLVFVDPCSGPVVKFRGGWIKQLKETIAYELGPDYLPDEFKLLPVRPRYNDKGEFDRAWLEGEFATGSIDQKANDPTFALFARLARMFAPPKET
jgi:hypothetical protein